MIHTQTEIDNLVELAIIQRAELKKLVDSLPQLRDHLSSEIERNLEEIEPAIRSELEQLVIARAQDAHAQSSAALTAKVDELGKALEVTTAARYSVLMAEREQNATLLEKAEARIAEAASALPSAVKSIVTDELSRFPRAGEIDQLRKEFAEPRGLNPRGKWTPNDTYQKLDLVTFNGDSFVSNINDNRERPGRNAENWTLNAARGHGGGGPSVASITDLIPAPSDGQILGSVGPNYVPKNLVAGANITITETPTQITIIGTEGQIELTDGTEAAPSLFFVSDTNTGMYRPAADTVGIVGGGHDILRLTDVASATDYVEIKNGTGVGNPLHILAEGASTNIGVHLQPKGSGLFTISDGTDFNKGIRFRSSSSAASAVTLIDAVSTAGRVVTLPDATDTLVGRATTDTLSNKTMIAPALGTPTALVGTNITGTAAGLTAGTVTTNANLTGDVTSVGNATSIAAGVIVDADINASAAIVDTKLATISTAGKVSNSATTAASANTASAIVARDASGNFTAGTITANLTGNVSGSSGSTTGNAATATALATGRTISITGDLAYTSPTFDGTGNVTAAGTLATVATPGSTGSSTAIPIVTINAKGLTTSITTAAVIAPAGTLSGTTLAAGVTASSLTSLGTIASLTATAGTVANAPSGSTDIANKLYVDTVAQGLDAKASCVAATTADITLSGAQTIDGVSIVAGNRVLVKNQSLSQNNGIYLCASGSWTRTTDANTWDALTSAFTFIEQGTLNGDCGFVCTANAGGTLGTTALPWSQFSGAGTFTAGTGLTLTGSVFSLTSPVAVANGGTGLTSLGSGVATFLGTPSSANLAAAVSDETGSGALVFATSPTLVTPALGTPSALVGTNITGTASGLTAGNVTTNANLTGAITSVGNATSLGSFTSANLASALTDETGSGANVFATSPTLVTPILGTPQSGTLTSCTGLPISTGVSGLGTGIATALAVNTGSAGAPVLFNGALGTPTSGTVTNLTGTASININGTVGATTPSTVAATTGTFSGTLNQSSSSAFQPQFIQTGSAADDTGTYFIGRRNRGGAAVQANDALSTLLFQGWDGSAYDDSAYISGTVASVSGGHVAGQLNFVTLDSAGVSAQRALITSTGLNSTAIGATTPSTIAATTATTTGNVGVRMVPDTDASLVIASSSTIAAGRGSLRISGANNTERIELQSTSAAGISGVVFSGTVASPTATTNGQSLLFIGGGGYDNTPSLSLNKGTVGINATENWTTTAQGTNITFNVTPNGSTTRSTVGTFSSTGLAVTGTVSATGNISNTFAGNVAIGHTLQDTTTTSGSVFINFLKSSGGVIGSIARVTTTDAVVYNTTSDGRLKENLRDFTDSGRLIDSLKPRVFDWKNSDEEGKNVVGFIAQESNAADPIFAHIGAVSVGDEDPETITKQWQRSDAALIPILVAELKSVRARLAALESK
jgi:hypothetical protein